MRRIFLWPWIWPLTHFQGHWTKWPISHLLLILELMNQLQTYKKPYIANLLVTLNLTFDLIFKVTRQNLADYWLKSLGINCGLIGSHMWRIFSSPWVWSWTSFSRSLNKVADISLKIDFSLQGTAVSCRALGPIFYGCLWNSNLDSGFRMYILDFRSGSWIHKYKI